MEEGCLSIPGKSIWIERPAKVRVKFQTLEGEYKYWCLHKMDARVSSTRVWSLRRCTYDWKTMSYWELETELWEILPDDSYDGARNMEHRGRIERLEKIFGIEKDGD